MDCLSLGAVQHFTGAAKPPSSEATLIKAMEEKGIGRPSTYAPTIGTLLDRNYVGKEKNRLVPTPLGTTVTDLLTEYFVRRHGSGIYRQDGGRAGRRFPRRASVGTHARPVLQSFPESSGGGPRFHAKDQGGRGDGGSLRELQPAHGYQDGTVRAIPGLYRRPGLQDLQAAVLKKTGATCPKCGGDIVERRSRGRGRSFYGCARYPNCDFLTNRRPLPTPCPECGGLMVQSGRETAACTACSWIESLSEDTEEMASVGG